MKLVNNAKMRLEKSSPKLLLALGLIGFGATVVLACKATVKAQPVLEECKTNTDEIKANVPEENNEQQKALTKEYAKTTGKLLKIYAGPALVGVVSVGSILGSHRILNNRYIGVATAYTALDNCYKLYRSRVIEKYGETVDEEILAGSSKSTISVSEEDSEGKVVKTKKTVIDADISKMLSPYAVFYSPDTTPDSTKDANYNYLHLKSAREHFQNELRSRNRVFLNEVLVYLGFKPTKAGQVMGWVFKPECQTDELSDDFISFGLDSIYNERFRRGQEYTAILDFNVVNVFEGLPDVCNEGLLNV